jgi:hypothetical protein
MQRLLRQSMATAFEITLALQRRAEEIPGVQLQRYPIFVFHQGTCYYFQRSLDQINCNA